MIHNGKVKWNQASLANDTADKSLFGSSSRKFERHYREPMLEPHYSFICTDDATLALKLEKTLKCPSLFDSYNVVDGFAYFRSCCG